jgi:hypothetical protein
MTVFLVLSFCSQCQWCGLLSTSLCEVNKRTGSVIYVRQAGQVWIAYDKHARGLQ